MEAFRERLLEIKRIIDDDVYRKRVLVLCQQTEPRSFEEYSSSGSFRRLEKFESSTYSEVLRAVDMKDNNKPVVMKIMRALSRGVIKRMPSVTTKGCQSYNDILNEIVVTQALSQLHDGVILNGQPSSLYRSHFFCQIHEIRVVSGNLQRTLMKSRKTGTPAIVSKPIEPQPHGVTTTDATTITSENRLSSEPAVSGASKKSADGTELPQRPATDQDSDADTSPLGSSSTTLRSRSDLTSDSKTGLSTISDEDGREMKRLNTELGPKLSVAMAVNQDKESTSKADDSKQPRAFKPMPMRPREEDDIFEKEVNEKKKQEGNTNDVDHNEEVVKDEELTNLPEEERMLMEALPHEYVITVMKHDGQPLWWMMTHKKLSSEQLVSVLVQVIVGLAIAETVYLYEHRDLHVSNILIKRTSNNTIPFIMDGTRYCVVSHGIKATIIDATFSRLTHNNRVYHRDLTSTLRAYGSKKTPVKMSLQNRSYRQMVRVTKNKWDEFLPKNNLIWLTYLCETLMKNEIMRADKVLLDEVRKVRDYTLKVNTTSDLLFCFPFERSTKADSSATAKSSGSKKAGKAEKAVLKTAKQ